MLGTESEETHQSMHFFCGVSNLTKSSEMKTKNGR